MSTHPSRRGPVGLAALALACAIGLSAQLSAPAAGAAPLSPAPVATTAPSAPVDPGTAATDPVDAAPVEAPPEPSAAEERVLPLVDTGEATPEELRAPAAPAAEPAVRELEATGELPASARTFSTSQAGPASTLVLYDSTGPYARIGEFYALGMGMLASHSGTVTAMPVADYQAGLAGRFTAVIYTGSTYNEPLPQAFKDDVLTGNVPVLWSGFNIWQLTANPQDRATFTSRYGWDAATSYIDSVDTVTAVSYNGHSLSRDPLNTGGLLVPHILRPEDVTVLGTGRCSQVSGDPTTCSSLAQTSGSDLPWAVRSGNLTYIGEVPLSYLSETDRYLAAADIVLDMLQPGAEPVRQAAVRIEDVNPTTPAAELRAIVDYLVGEGVPFQLAVVPIYTDGKGAYNDGVAETYTLAESPELVEVLAYAVQHGGTLVQHGTSHQFSTLDNPYNGVSTDDFEFIRSWCTQVNDVNAPQVRCEESSWVQIGGDLPGVDAAWAAQQVRAGQEVFASVGLPVPTIFETPHYAATPAAYTGISQVYPVRYERELLHVGLLSGQTPGPFDYYGQFFPYSVNDPYGTHILPENIGNVALEAYNQHPPRLPQRLLAASEANLVGTHVTASFFFHPFYDVSYLRQTVEGIRAQGYTFVPASELR